MAQAWVGLTLMLAYAAPARGTVLGEDPRPPRAMRPQQTTSPETVTPHVTQAPAASMVSFGTPGTRVGARTRPPVPPASLNSLPPQQYGSRSRLSAHV